MNPGIDIDMIRRIAEFLQRTGIAPEKIAQWLKAPPQTMMPQVPPVWPGKAPLGNPTTVEMMRPGFSQPTPPAIPPPATGSDDFWSGIKTSQTRVPGMPWANPRDIQSLPGMPAPQAGPPQGPAPGMGGTNPGGPVALQGGGNTPRPTVPPPFVTPQPMTRPQGEPASGISQVPRLGEGFGAKPPMSPPNFGLNSAQMNIPPKSLSIPNLPELSGLGPAAVGAGAPSPGKPPMIGPNPGTSGLSGTFMRSGPSASPHPMLAKGGAGLRGLAGRGTNLLPLLAPAGLALGAYTASQFPGLDEPFRKAGEGWKNFGNMVTGTDVAGNAPRGLLGAAPSDEPEMLTPLADEPELIAPGTYSKKKKKVASTPKTAPRFDVGGNAPGMPKIPIGGGGGGGGGGGRLVGKGTSTPLLPIEQAMQDPAFRALMMEALAPSSGASNPRGNPQLRGFRDGM